jgi:hydroxymethylglutaryl-CoA lyase
VSNAVQIFEVGPRDGLQNESRVVSLEDKLWLISGLVKAGVRDMEIGAFVRPDRVKQMADTDEIYRKIGSGELALGKARAWSLVPNMKGLERARALNANRLAVFTAASESFTKTNIGMSIDQSLAEFKTLIDSAGKKVKFRGYVSTAFGCPFEGKVAPAKVLKVVERLAKLGVEQVSIGDTIGVGTPGQVDQIIKPALKMLGPKRVAVHFHDTRGTALANTLRSLEHGVRIVDSSAGGLGGCPFAPGATGNLATEDLVYMLNGTGMKTGIQLEKLAALSLEFARRMKRPISSRYLQAYAAQCSPTP